MRDPNAPRTYIVKNEETGEDEEVVYEMEDDEPMEEVMYELEEDINEMDSNSMLEIFNELQQLDELEIVDENEDEDDDIGGIAAIRKKL